MELFPTVFIDRDGTINYDAGYINHVDSFNIYPYAAEAIRLLNINKFLVVVITNQSGLGRGFFTIDTMHEIHEKMNFILNKNGAYIDKLYYCPHDVNAKAAEYKVDCDCRKPKTGMVDSALAELPIDKNKMYFIGDKHSDIETGYKSGCKTIMVETGYGKGEIIKKYDKWEIKPDYITDNLLNATRLIIKSCL